mmetsp:Transcript_15766/g.40817  ORF Transcript_15766/g.40817 Transcript_15766/m.40817 type:complete len:297 (+) Transcript_15766:120-1010(+)
MASSVIHTSLAAGRKMEHQLALQVAHRGDVDHNCAPIGIEEGRHLQRLGMVQLVQRALGRRGVDRHHKVATSVEANLGEWPLLALPEARRSDGAARVQHACQPHRRNLHLRHLGHFSDGDHLAPAGEKLDPDTRRGIVHDALQPPAVAAVSDELAMWRRMLRAVRLHVLDPHARSERGRVLIVRVELPAVPVPRGALHVEDAHDAAAVVPVPHLEQRLAVTHDVTKDGVHGRPPRQVGPQDAAVRQHQPAQQVKVVAPRLVADVDGAAGDGARRGVQEVGGVLRLKHVPIGLHQRA